MIDQDKERTILDAVAADSWYEAPTGIAMINYCYNVFRRYMRPSDKVLELGPAEGTMTELLLRDGFNVEAVDGSKTFVSLLKKKFQSFGNFQVHEALFEEYLPTKKFDIIILGHVLEHVDDPVAILSLLKDWLVPGTGRILVAVPNARSLHRQAAAIMGLLESEYTMSEKDIHHGHRRIYNPETLRADFLKAGLKIQMFGGYWLKPLADKQLTEQWSSDQLTAYMALGERYPDIAAELFVIAS